MEPTKVHGTIGPDEPVIEFRVRLLSDKETFAVRYDCPCGCHPQVKLRQGAEAEHEHCCCGIAHAAGPGARAHLERYLAERRLSGLDEDRTYAIQEAQVQDPWSADVEVAYARPRQA